jgi:hypothetical protein
MAYDRSDLRSQLSTAPPVATGANVAPQYFEYDNRPPSEMTPGGSSLWWARSQAVVFNYARLQAGEQLDRPGQPDEYVVLIHDRAATVTVSAGEQSEQAVGRSIIVMPPGTSSLVADRDIEVVRLFSTVSEDLCDRCDNVEFYAEPDPNVPGFAPWPEPVDGYRIRVYPLDDVPADPQRFGRLYRCSTFMINYFYEAPGPRDPSKLSPHFHDDFEQLSLQLGGDYVHHIRTPWTVDRAAWRDDEHQYCTSPSVTVIPPPAIHTSEAVGEAVHQLVDIFCPPRADFSAKPGWVLNADEYPMPI